MASSDRSGKQPPNPAGVTPERQIPGTFLERNNLVSTEGERISATVSERRLLDEDDD